MLLAFLHKKNVKLVCRNTWRVLTPNNSLSYLQGHDCKSDSFFSPSSSILTIPVKAPQKSLVRIFHAMQNIPPLETTLTRKIPTTSLRLGMLCETSASP